MRKALTLLVCGMCLSFVAQAQCNPEDWVESFYDWGKTFERFALDQVAMSAAAEEEIGDSLHREMVKDKKVVADHPQQQYLSNLVKKISRYTTRKNIDYDIHVLKDKRSLNAFSIAGGHLYITEKMLDWVESEAELAFILAHEIAHVDHKHSVGKVQKMILSKELSRHFLGEEYTNIAANLSLLLTAPFGQIDEYEADRQGAVLALKAGYNPRDGMRFFEKMGHDEQFHIVEKIIRTHPYSVERINCLDDFLRNDLKK